MVITALSGDVGGRGVVMKGDDGPGSVVVWLLPITLETAPGHSLTTLSPQRQQRTILGSRFGFNSGRWTQKLSLHQITSYIRYPTGQDNSIRRATATTTATAAADPGTL